MRDLFIWGNKGEFSPSLYQDGYAEDDLLRYMHLNNIFYNLTSTYQTSVPNALLDSDTLISNTYYLDSKKGVKITPNPLLDYEYDNGVIAVKASNTARYLEIVLYPNILDKDNALQELTVEHPVIVSCNYMETASGVTTQDTIETVIKSLNLDTETYKVVVEGRDYYGGNSYMVGAITKVESIQGNNAVKLKVPIIPNRPAVITNFKVSDGTVALGGIQLPSDVGITLTNTNSYTELGASASQSQRPTTGMFSGYAKGSAVRGLSSVIGRVFTLSPSKSLAEVDYILGTALPEATNTVLNIMSAPSSDTLLWGNSVLELNTKVISDNVATMNATYTTSIPYLQTLLEVYATSDSINSRMIETGVLKSDMETAYLSKEVANTSYQQSMYSGYRSGVNVPSNTNVIDIVRDAPNSAIPNFILKDMGITKENNKTKTVVREYVITPYAYSDFLRQSVHYQSKERFNKYATGSLDSYTRAIPKLAVIDNSLYYSDAYYTMFNSSWYISSKVFTPRHSVKVTAVKIAGSDQLLIMLGGASLARAYQSPDDTETRTALNLHKTVVMVDVNILIGRNSSLPLPSYVNTSIVSYANSHDYTKMIEELYARDIRRTVYNKVFSPYVSNFILCRGEFSTVNDTVSTVFSPEEVAKFDKLQFIHRSSGGHVVTTVPNPWYEASFYNPSDFMLVAQNLEDGTPHNGALYGMTVRMSVVLVNNERKVAFTITNRISRNLATGSTNSARTYVLRGVEGIPPGSYVDYNDLSIEVGL